MKKIIFSYKLFFIFLTLLFLPSFLKYKTYAQEFKKSIDIKKLIDTSEYILGPGDKIFLRYFGEKEFSGEVDILNDGTISIPIVGDTNVTGLTKKIRIKRNLILFKIPLNMNLYNEDYSI